MSQLKACTAVMNGAGLAHAHATRLEAEAEFKDDRADCLVEEHKDMRHGIKLKNDKIHVLQGEIASEARAAEEKRSKCLNDCMREYETHRDNLKTKVTPVDYGLGRCGGGKRWKIEYYMMRVRNMMHGAPKPVRKIEEQEGQGA